MAGLGQSARAAAAELAHAQPQHKNQALLAIAEVLEQRREFILQENKRDLEAAAREKASTSSISVEISAASSSIDSSRPLSPSGRRSSRIPRPVRKRASELSC